MSKDVLVLIDRKSFPKKCPELEDLKLLLENHQQLDFETEDPTIFFKKAMELTDEYELIVPVTRNFYVRDRLRMEGVSLIVSL